jgi:phospholipid-binding lipoprotein MlaA
MKRLLLAIILMLSAAGCGGPTARWSGPGHPATGPGNVRVYLVRYQTSLAQPDPDDPGLAEKFDQLDEERDEFDEFDELEDELLAEMADVPDPLEGWNRAMFQFNDALYFAVGKPVLQGYEAVVPQMIRLGIRNFFHNLRMPVRAVNCLLQGRWEGAGAELARFGINSTVGCLGIMDIAKEEFEILPVEADLGQTLGVWGIGDGCYLVWPLLGPSTIRDSAGRFGDAFLAPLAYVRPFWIPISARALRGINDGSFRIGEYEVLKSDALDPYVAIRQAYIQYRRRKILDARSGETGVEYALLVVPEGYAGRITRFQPQACGPLGRRVPPGSSAGRAVGPRYHLTPR